MRAGNTIPAAKVFDRGATVSLLIPLPLRLGGELRRLFCRVVQHTRAGYQLNTQWGLLSGRFQHTQLNGVDNDFGDIPDLSVHEAKNQQKFKLTEVVAKCNARGPIRSAQRAGQKKRRGKRRLDQVVDQEDEGSDTIEVEVRPARRQRIQDKEGSSPSIRAAGRGRGRARKG
jgi:hypothetical protein